MATLDIGFETWIDSRGYEFLRGRRYSKMLPNGAFRPKGGPLVGIRPLDFHPALYKQFADLPDDPEAYIEFMRMFGPITYAHSPERGYRSEEWGWDQEQLAYVVEGKIRLQQLIEDWQAESWKDLAANFSASVPAELRLRSTGGLGLSLAPLTLYDAMLLQFGQAVSGSRALRACGWCGVWFEIGAKSKRSSARFCSDRCRTHFHNDRRLKGANS